MILVLNATAWTFCFVCPNCTVWVCFGYVFSPLKGLTLHFFFKFVSWAYCSKIHWPNESPRKQKCSLVKRGYIPKTFPALHFFVFWGTHLVNVFLNNMPVKQIWRKSAVWSGFKIIAAVLNQMPNNCFAKKLTYPNEIIEFWKLDCATWIFTSK